MSMSEASFIASLRCITPLRYELHHARDAESHA
jgi:hypothetical protein